MATVAGNEHPLSFDLAAPAAARSSFLAAWLLVDAPLVPVLLLAAVPVLIGVWDILSPPLILSQEMTWDLLFNLAGAWQMHLGQVPHVDFHEPVGQLNFALTEMGFNLVGVGPRAFLAGAILMAITLFVCAAIAAWRRLPALPAAIFVAFASLLALMPANVGDQPNAYSFAMSYNRYGWSCISILFLLLFLPPRKGRHGAWSDIAVAAALLLAMFYLKMTYFVVGMAALPVAILVSGHARTTVGWYVVAMGGIGLALAPSNHPYWIDLFMAAQAGQFRDAITQHLNNFFAHAAEYAPYIAALAVAAWMWWRHEAPARLPIATGFILAAAFALLSQNAQTHGLPAAVIITFLFYDVLRERRLQRRPGSSIAILLSLLVFPLLSVAAASVSLAGYNSKASRQTLRSIDGTNLHGLSVPSEQPGLLAAFAGSNADYHLLNRVRAIGSRYELSPDEYVETLLDAAELLAEFPGRRDGVVLLDQVNPLPFMLGLRPSRGSNLWSGPGAPVRSASSLFADADCVLVPKFSTYSAWTNAALAQYGPYLRQFFPQRMENRSWILLSRPFSGFAASDAPLVEPDFPTVASPKTDLPSQVP